MLSSFRLLNGGKNYVFTSLTVIGSGTMAAKKTFHAARGADLNSPGSDGSACGGWFAVFRNPLDRMGDVMKISFLHFLLTIGTRHGESPFVI